jgi:hypothetical protein
MSFLGKLGHKILFWLSEGQKKTAVRPRRALQAFESNFELLGG